MIRVLHVFGGLGTGGTESLIMNWYRNIDRSKIQFDFLVRSPDDNYLEEITALGGRVFYTASFPRHLLRNFLETRKILQRKEWDVIHVHSNAAMYMLPLRLAKKLGYQHRIMHSHSVHSKNPVFSLVHRYNRKKINKYTTHQLACSNAAGEWMYPDSAFCVVNNAVQVDKFLFDQKVRNEIRTAMGIDNSLVLGHVGRFSKPKNHSFLLDIFYEVKQLQPDSVLMLVGDGELQEAVKEKAKALGLTESVLFMGRRSDIGQLMSAMDIFLLPSLYEGLPVVCVESSANALISIISEEAYAQELDCFPNVKSVTLKKSASEWAAFVLGNLNNAKPIYRNRNLVEGSSFDVDLVIKTLQDIYLTR